MAALSDKQKRFCDEYLISFNATQSAIKAGYSKKTAAEQGYQLLQKTSCITYLNLKKEKVERKLDISLERTMTEIGRVAYQDVRKFFDEEGGLIPIHKLDDDAAATIAGMDIEEMFETGEGGEKIWTGYLKKIKRADKMKALEMLAKHFKIYSDAPVSNNNVNLGAFSAEELKTLVELKKKSMA